MCDYDRCAMLHEPIESFLYLDGSGGGGREEGYEKRQKEQVSKVREQGFRV